MLMPPAARPATAVNLSSVAIAPYCAGNTAASTGAGVVARIVASGSATTAYMRTARAARVPPPALRASTGKNAVETAPATNSGARDSAALTW